MGSLVGLGPAGRFYSQERKLRRAELVETDLLVAVGKMFEEEFFVLENCVQ